jgi:hypothetical protein
MFVSSTTSNNELHFKVTIKIQVVETFLCAQVYVVVELSIKKEEKNTIHQSKLSGRSWKTTQAF